MPERDFEIAELEAILELPADHPRHRQLQDDPGFRAAVHAYRRFLDMGKAQPDTEMSEAEAKLEKFIDRQVFDGATPVGRLAAETPPRHWWQLAWLRRVAVCCLLAVAAVGFYSVYGPVGQSGLIDPEPGRTINLRDGATTEAGSPVLDFVSMQTLSDGSIRITWRSIQAAEIYQLLVIDPDLVPVATFSAGADTSLLIAADETARLRALSSQLVVRVEALAAGDPIAHSHTMAWPPASD